MRVIRLCVLPALAALLFAVACRGGADRPIEVSWDAEGSAVNLADEGSGASPLQTVVYVTNNTDSVVRDAVIRLSEDAAEREIGLTLGTVTTVSTNFEGNTRVWRLGDLEAGKRYGLPIGLWFTSLYVSAAPDQLVLAVELASPDLTQPIRSELALTLKK